MMAGDEWLDELIKNNKGKVDMSGRLDMSVTGGPQRHTVYHSYMVSYIYGKFQFGSLVMKEDFDTNIIDILLLVTCLQDFVLHLNHRHILL